MKNNIEYAKENEQERARQGKYVTLFDVCDCMSAHGDEDDARKEMLSIFRLMACVACVSARGGKREAGR